MSATIHPVAERLYALAEDLAAERRQVVRRDAATGRIVGADEVRVDHAAAIREGLELGRQTLTVGSGLEQLQVMDAAARFAEAHAKRTGSADSARLAARIDSAIVLFQETGSTAALEAISAPPKPRPQRRTR